MPTSTASRNSFTITPPELAPLIASEIVKRVRIIAEHPQLGRPIAGREDFRELVLPVLKAAYVFRYAYDGNRLVMLRVFHSREQREA
ncbi:MAG TPA: type II toxin-antitoxin system RelE/ParE family toxin [Bradyrhizobium sp.]